MTSEALGVSVAPSFFHSCVSDGKTATMEDVQRFKVSDITAIERYYMQLSTQVDNTLPRDFVLLYDLELYVNVSVYNTSVRSAVIAALLGFYDFRYLVNLLFKL